MYGVNLYLNTEELSGYTNKISTLITTIQTRQETTLGQCCKEQMALTSIPSPHPSISPPALMRLVVRMLLDLELRPTSPELLRSMPLTTAFI